VIEIDRRFFLSTVLRRRGEIVDNFLDTNNARRYIQDVPASSPGALNTAPTPPDRAASRLASSVGRAFPVKHFFPARKKMNDLFLGAGIGSLIAITICVLFLDIVD